MIEQNVKSKIIFQGDNKSKLKVVEATTVILFFTGGVNFRLSLMTYFNTTKSYHLADHPGTSAGKTIVGGGGFVHSCSQTVKTMDFKRNLLGKTQIYKYSPPQLSICRRQCIPTKRNHMNSLLVLYAYTL